MLFTRHITETLFSALNEQYPGSIKDKEFRNFLMYALFGSWTPFDSNHLLLNQKVCSILQGKELSGHYSSKPYLDRMKTLLPGLKIQEWVHDGIIHGENLTGKTHYEDCGRILIEDGIAPSLKDLAAQETDKILLTPKNELIHYFKGTKFNQKISKFEMEEEDKKTAARVSATNVVELQKSFLDYFNGLDTNSFTKIVNANLEAAIALVKTFPFKYEQTRRLNLNTLMTIKMNPKPIYFATEKSRRLYGVGSTILTLKREIRKTLTKGWIEFDMVNCHLAIIAKDWNIPELTKLLKQGSIWQHLEGFGLNMEKAKPTLKKVIYGMVYGQSKAEMIRVLMDGGFTKPQSKNFFVDIPIMKAIFEARQKELNSCLFMPVDCFGEPIKHDIPKPKKQISKDGKELRSKNGEVRYSPDFKPARSVLAQKAQAVELKMLEPVLDFSRDNEHMMLICLYQFDGFSAICKHKTRTKTYCNKLKSVLDEHIQKMGYQTFIEWKVNE